AIFSEIGNLTALETIDFALNKFTSIPASIGSLIKLKTLNLSSNALTNIDSSFSTLKLTDLNFQYQSISIESIELGANEIAIDLPLHLVTALNNEVVTFDAKNEFQLFVNGIYKKTSYSNNGKLVFTNINLLNLKETDILRIYQTKGIAAYSNINYGKVSFGKPLVNEEFDILKKIYASTFGASWTNKWDITENNLNTVSWFGVSIKDGHVVSINLFNNNLSGVLPAEITGLKYLKIINLSNNKIAGSLPNNLHVLTDLEVLDLNSNLLSGAIPSRIAELQKLKKFAIGNNKFSGSIPSALSDFIALEYLDLSSNSFDKIIKKIYYDYSKTYIDLRNQIINYDINLNVEGSQLKVDLSDIVKYELEKNNFDAKNSFALLVNNVTHTTTITNDLGEIIFNNVRIGEIPLGAKITIRQTTGSFRNTEFNFKGIEDKSNVPVVQQEYLALVELYNQLNGSQWTNKWTVTTNNLNTTKWFGVTTYDGHIVAINLSTNNVSGIVPNIFDKLPYLTKLNLSSNKLTGIASTLPSTIDFAYDRQSIDVGDLDLNTATVINDLSINRYDHTKRGFYNQTYDLRIGSFSRTVNMAEEGIKLMDIMTFWKVPIDQKIELRQISGNAKNSVVNFNLKYKMGDSNLDGNLNVLDIQTGINYILDNYSNYFNYSATDVNNDNQISILDIIGQVKIIQNQGSRPSSNRNSAPKDVELKPVLSIENGMLLIDTKGNDVASFEILINKTTKDAIQELISAQGFSVNLNEKDNQVNIIAYSFNTTLKGKIIVAKINEIAPQIESAILSDRNAVEIPNEIIGTTLETHSIEIVEPSKIYNVPNPFNDETTIEFFSNNAAKATFSVYDISGRKVLETTLGHLVNGQNHYKFNRNKLPSGVYLYTIDSENNSAPLKGKMTVN
ncbi:T9SS type A sorting domain-containing protein, partial [Flavobacterium myungsuense]